MQPSRATGLAAVAVLMLAGSGWMPQGQRRALSGDLTKPISQYSGDELFTLVNRLNFTGGQERARRCTGAAGCAAALRTNVRVDGVADTDSLSATTLPQFGVIAARLIVRGNQTEAGYGMLPNNGRYSYYLIVERGAGGAATWRLEELSAQGQTRTHRTLRTGQFRNCNHPFQRGARADFRTCAQAAGGGQDGIFRNAVFVPAQGSGDPPIWIGCAAGCCTADL